MATELLISQSHGLKELRVPKERLEAMARDAVRQARRRPMKSGLTIVGKPAIGVWTRYGQTPIVVLVAVPEPQQSVPVVFLLTRELDARLRELGVQPEFEPA